ncbi:hypothetical protein CGRA01v4_02262 [Colletotrichum graminicola]|nr:hypothetical protein CGRA01v4_02262 [Colletotrichum graminicola]
MRGWHLPRGLVPWPAARASCPRSTSHLQLSQQPTQQGPPGHIPSTLFRDSPVTRQAYGAFTIATTVLTVGCCIGFLFLHYMPCRVPFDPNKEGRRR